VAVGAAGLHREELCVERRELAHDFCLPGYKFIGR